MPLKVTSNAEVMHTILLSLAVDKRNTDTFLIKFDNSQSVHMSPRAANKRSASRITEDFPASGVMILLCHT